MNGIVLVEFQTYQRTIQYIDDVLKASDTKIDAIVIVDNSIDHSGNSACFVRYGLQEVPIPSLSRKNWISSMHQAVYQNVVLTYILASDNLGYAKGNNLGIEYLDTIGVDTILISNNDIQFPQETFAFSRLMEAVKRKNVVASGSDVFGLDGNRQSPCRFLSLRDRWHRGMKGWPLCRIFYRKVSETFEPKEEGPVYRFIGAFFVIDTKKFMQIGMFDEHTFLYGEELILAERAKAHGYRMYYVPGVWVVHEDGFSTKKKFASNPYKKLETQMNSDLYYYETYCGVSKKEIEETRRIFATYQKRRETIKKWMGRK